jgi:cytochrome c-type biogenesis protein
MILLGLVFTVIFKVSLTKIIGIISPIAFAFLGVISIMLIFNVDFARFLPTMKSPTANNPLFSALWFGFFFGAIVVPCNPLFIAALFTTALSTTGLILNMFQFLAFGLGIGVPLLVLSAISATKSQVVIGWLTRHKRSINLVTGAIMLIIALYYLTCVFAIFGLGMYAEPVCKPLSAIFGAFV